MNCKDRALSFMANLYQYEDRANEPLGQGASCLQAFHQDDVLTGPDVFTGFCDLLFVKP